MSCYPCAPGDAVRARLGSVIRFSEDAVLPETLPHPDLVAALPRLRRYARVLTGDMHRADDLVQDTLARAWEKRRVWGGGEEICRGACVGSPQRHAKTVCRPPRRIARPHPPPRPY